MRGEAYVESAGFELRFWTQVLGDHARFIERSLAPGEGAEIRRARYYRDKFDSLLDRARTARDEGSCRQLSRDSLDLTASFREFKLHLLKRHLTGELGSSLSPTFYNHMVNELEESMRVQQALADGQIAPLFSLPHQHLLWLLDAGGHASALDANLDGSEQGLKRKCREFERHFQDYYVKAVELAGYMRTNLPEFPAMKRFNRDVELEMKVFRGFLSEIKEWELSREVLGTLTPLMPDHMLREECYYLTKLALLTGGEPPECDPGKPRTEA